MLSLPNVKVKAPVVSKVGAAPMKPSSAVNIRQMTLILIPNPDGRYRRISYRLSGCSNEVTSMRLKQRTTLAEKKVTGKLEDIPHPTLDATIYVLVLVSPQSAGWSLMARINCLSLNANSPTKQRTWFRNIAKLTQAN